MNDVFSKTITLGEFIDAMELNGYPQARGNWVTLTKGGTKVIRACALGQGIINLGLDRQSFEDQFRQIKFAEGFYAQSFTAYVMMLNDVRKYSIKTIVRMAREQFKHELNTRLTVKTKRWIKEK